MVVVVVVVLVIVILFFLSLQSLPPPTFSFAYSHLFPLLPPLPMQNYSFSKLEYNGS